MVKGSRLRNALDRYKGRDHKLEQQKKLQKQAEKRKRAKLMGQEEDVNGARDSDVDMDQEETGSEAGPSEDGGVQIHGEREEASGSVDWETDEEEEDVGEDGHEDDNEEALMAAVSRLNDSESSSESEFDDAPEHQEEVDGEEEAEAGAEGEEDNENNEEEDASDAASDIPLSDIASLSSDERADIVPYQRLTINNTTALLKSLKSIALPISRLPFSEHQSITSATPTDIPADKIDDDLERELAFYQQSLSAVKQARALLRKEGVAFSRPADYFAEMVKSDEHMGRVKQKLVDAAANKRAAADARRQRDLKKFGKQVQVAKLQERDKAKRETLEKISLLKRKRQTGDDLKTNEDDLFDIALEDAATSEKRREGRDRDKKRGKASGGPDSGSRGKSNFKRQKKNEKYGFGGKKRFGKSGDAVSSADMSGFSGRRMKEGSFAGGGSGGGGGGGGMKKGGAAKRLGKSRRAKRA